MHILVLGCSDVFLRRVLPALDSCAKITKIHIASKSKTYSMMDSKFFGKLGLWFDDYSIAINSSCSDLVYISLPNSLHFIWAKQSLDAGINVIVEKPATLNISDTKFLIDLSHKKNLCFAESTVWPFHPNIEIVKERLIPFKDNSIEVDAVFTCLLYTSPSPRDS